MQKKEGSHVRRGGGAPPRWGKNEKALHLVLFLNAGDSSGSIGKVGEWPRDVEKGYNQRNAVSGGGYKIRICRL